MDIEELVQEIAKIKEQLDKLQKALENKEYKRWTPQNSEEYYIIDSIGEVQHLNNNTLTITNGHLNFFNCFKTKTEAEAEAEKNPNLQTT